MRPGASGTGGAVGPGPLGRARNAMGGERLGVIAHELIHVLGRGHPDPARFPDSIMVAGGGDGPTEHLLHLSTARRCSPPTAASRPAERRTRSTWNLERGPTPPCTSTACSISPGPNSRSGPRSRALVDPTTFGVAGCAGVRTVPAGYGRVPGRATCSASRNVPLSRTGRFAYGSRERSQLAPSVFTKAFPRCRTAGFDRRTILAWASYSSASE